MVRLLIACPPRSLLPIPSLDADVTDSESFGRANFWLNEVLHNVPDCKLYLVGCKGTIRISSKSRFSSLSPFTADLVASKEKKRQVRVEDVRILGDNVGVAGLADTSALSGAGVDALFHQIAVDWVKVRPSFIPVST